MRSCAIASPRSCSARCSSRMLAGTATVAARSHRHATALVQRRHHLSAHRAARRLRRRGDRGLQVRPPVRDEGHEQGQRQDDQRHLRRRQGRPGDRRLRREGPDRPGRTRSSMGTGSSGVALQMAPLAAQNQVLYISGPAASDAITGVNKYTFRAGRQTYQDVSTRPSYLKGSARRSSSSTRTRSSATATTPRSRPSSAARGTRSREISVPLTATDFTPFAQQAKNANPDLIFVAWAGTTAGAMWKALDQQNVVQRRRRRHRSRRARDLGGAGRPGDEDPLPVALHLHGAEEQGQRLARAADAQAQPGAGHLHAGRLRAGADARPRAAEGRRRRRTR